jgi:DNA (cytosine-5)-methyltransferase 1
MLKFIDLFAGIGGFHLALQKLGHECVFACEINKALADLYEKNYDIKPVGDIRKVDIKNIPSHDILCAGFPCQPFSKAGKMLGRNDNTVGNLIDEILKILHHHKPSFFILENVPFIAKQDNKAMWKYIKTEFARAGYESDEKIFSPHQFGIPQHRQRIYIIGSRKGLKHFSWIKPQKNELTDIKSILDINPLGAKPIGKDELECLNLWQEFIDCIPKNVPIPKFPIWGMEFGATYPIEDGKTFAQISDEELGEYKGIFGKSLKGLTREQQEKYLPSHAFNTDKNKNYPNWKKRYIQKNRDFYATYETELKNVVAKISEIPIASWHKLEWNVGDVEREIKNYIIQFRASGIRLKKTDTSPSLVCTNTQIPIIGWENRYITKAEGARLQSIEGIQLPDNYGTCFKALGNAVNVEIIYRIAQQLINEDLANKVVKLEITEFKHSLNLFSNGTN